MGKSRQCDCTHFPWPAQCVDFCGALLLLEASEQFLTDVLNLEPELVQEILIGREGQAWKSLEDLIPVFPDQWLHILMKLEEYNHRSETKGEGEIAETM